VTLTEPAVATVLAVLIVGEQLTVLGWTGLGIIAVVLVILALAPPNAPDDRSVESFPVASAAQTAISAGPRPTQGSRATA